MGHYLAFDFGAESGRALLGSLTDGKLVVEELHRFPNGGVCIGDRIHWDVLRIWEQILQGLGRFSAIHRSCPLSLGVDGWGIDYGLLDNKGRLISNPVHYRDPRTEGVPERLFDIIDAPSGWNDEMGYGADLAAQPPLLVVTRTPPDKVRLADRTTFVVDGIASAVAKGIAMAEARDVVIMGGGETIRRAIEAGVVDELRLHLSPVLLGGGIVHGATDDVGYKAIEHPHYYSDLHATILHQLGLDHSKMEISVVGRPMRLVEQGHGPITEILT